MNQLSPRSCSIPECGCVHYARDLCHKHYQRWRTHGDPAVRFPVVSLSERLWARVTKAGPDECWLWSGAIIRNGYGSIAVGRGNKTALVHRVAYELLVGPIPEELVLDHLCRNRACVNPAHLEPVTSAENTRRGLRNQNTTKTHCPQGHPYDDDNTYLSPDRRRHCRQCKRNGRR